MDLDETENCHVSFGDASKILVHDKENILIQIKNGSDQLISNVCYAPQMKANIISLEQLLEKMQPNYYERYIFEY